MKELSYPTHIQNSSEVFRNEEFLDMKYQYNLVRQIVLTLKKLRRL